MNRHLAIPGGTLEPLLTEPDEECSAVLASGGRLECLEHEPMRQVIICPQPSRRRRLTALDQYLAGFRLVN